MTEVGKYLDCWVSVAASLFSQTLPGDSVLSEAPSLPLPQDIFGFTATISGDEHGAFVVILDRALLDANLFGEGAEQKVQWGELLKEVSDAAIRELRLQTGRKCLISSFSEVYAESDCSRALQLQCGERAFVLQIHNEVRLREIDEVSSATVESDGTNRTPAGWEDPADEASESNPHKNGIKTHTRREISPGLELLLDVELEVSLRFGAREMPLSEILNLGPGDVVQLDRYIHDPVDLIVGDKIVARGDVVLVNGNFGLRITEISEPQQRLESIRCLF